MGVVILSVFFMFVVFCAACFARAMACVLDCEVMGVIIFSVVFVFVVFCAACFARAMAWLLDGEEGGSRE